MKKMYRPSTNINEVPIRITVQVKVLCRSKNSNLILKLRKIQKTSQNQMLVYTITQNEWIQLSYF